MKKSVLILLLSSIVLISFSHPWKPTHHVIIDTDAGLDDMRTISMLLASDDVKILGIIVSAGVLSPYEGYKKVKSMLDSYHHSGIPVAMNYNLRGHDMPVPGSLKWGDEANLPVPETNGFNKLYKNISKYEDSKITFISLASLNSISELVSGGVVAEEKIKEIVWSNNNLSRLNGFNAAIDIRSANKVIKGNIPLISISYPISATFYDATYLEDLKKIGNRYTEKLIEVAVSNPELANHTFAQGAADEMVAIYLHSPELFTESTIKNQKHLKPGPIEKLKESSIRIFKGGIDKGLQVMKNIPSDTSFFQPDLQPFIKDIILNNGIEEWESGVIANELHRHLGIYSIIGVKMGILAREYFGAGIDEIKISSFAGVSPPMSCLNDGLQVSTGATIGHGLIEVDLSAKEAAAIFEHMGSRIKISIRNDLAEEISEELNELMVVNGLDSDVYWELVRQRAILHWKNLDKYEIFNIETLQSLN